MTSATVSLNSTKVKFRLAGGAQPLILLPVHVNDRGPFDFILDTGAGTSLLSSELAKQLETKVIGSKEGQSAGGKVSVSLAKVESIAVGETKLHDVDVGVVDLAQIGKTVGAKREVPIRLASPAKPLILVDVHANGRGPFQFAIDTGTSTTAIAPELAKELGVESSPVGAGTTGGAPIDFSAGTLQSFQLGGTKIDNMPVVVADFFTILNPAIGAKLDGIVGYHFLPNYKTVIDYP